MGMSIYGQMNDFIADIWSRINKIEERALATGLEADVSVTEINIIEKIVSNPCKRMSDVARAVGVTLATMTVACDKLEAKGLITRSRDSKDKRVVNVSLTAKGLAAYEFHKSFREELMQGMLNGLSEQEQQLLLGSMQKLERFFSVYENP